MCSGQVQNNKKLVNWVYIMKIMIADSVHYCFIGVEEFEHKIKSKLSITLSIEFPGVRFMERPDIIRFESLYDTISYSELSKIISVQVKDSFHLLENLAQAIATDVLSLSDRIQECTIEVKKFACIENADYVSVIYTQKAENEASVTYAEKAQ